MEKKKTSGSASRNEPERQHKKKPKPAVEKKQARSDPSVPKTSAAQKERLRHVLIAAVALLAVCGIVLSTVSMRSERLQRKVTLIYAGLLQEDCVFPIELSDEQVRQSVRNTKRHGDTHAFSYFCSRTLQLDADNLGGYILFGNPADNDCDLVLSIFDQEDNVIYRSGGLTPGKYITTIRPSVEWENGEYACRAVVTAYEGQGLEYKCIGAQYSRLTVKVGETP